MGCENDQSEIPLETLTQTPHFVAQNQVVKSICASQFGTCVQAFTPKGNSPSHKLNRKQIQLLDVKSGELFELECSVVSLLSRQPMLIKTMGRQPIPSKFQLTVN
jgi:hypothetical protein